MVYGGMSLVKYLLFIFNFLFVISGITLIAVGAVVYNEKGFTEFLGSKFVTAPTILIVIGCIVFLVAFMGCCGAVKENYCMVMTFAVLVFIIFVIEVAGGITAYVHKDDVTKFLKDSMNASFTQGKDKKLWEDIQTSMKCCGVNGPSDYKTAVPQACCVTNVEGCKEYNEKGCFDALSDKFMGKIGMIGGVAVGIGVVELLGVVFAVCLGSAIKKEYEGV